MFTAPDAHMYTSLNLYIMSIQPADKAIEHQIIHMTSIGKENRSSQCLSYKELWGGGGGGDSHSHKQARAKISMGV